MKVEKIVAANTPRERWQVWTGQPDVAVETVLEAKDPKTVRSGRTIRLEASDTAILEVHCVRQAEEWLKLAIRIQDTDYVFPALSDKGHKQGERPKVLDPDLFTHGFARLLRKLKIKRRGLSFHSLRHTNVSLLLSGGADPKAVSQRVGHSTPATTLNIYQHSSRDKMSKPRASRARSSLPLKTRKHEQSESPCIHKHSPVAKGVAVFNETAAEKAKRKGQALFKTTTIDDAKTAANQGRQRAADAETAKTERLRALRLAKEAADAKQGRSES